ncbi:MAG: type II secretion system F family protein [Candidatus Aenigmarchaeota archaeon]|nr:type II secretion system F family protein [Candidatus Aenigmarchaeota archaeon]
MSLFGGSKDAKAKAARKLAEERKKKEKMMKAEAARKKAEEERKRAEKEARKRAEKEKRKAKEMRKREEQERKRAEKEAKRKAKEARKRAEKEKRKAEKEGKPGKKPAEEAKEQAYAAGEGGKGDKAAAAPAGEAGQEKKKHMGFLPRIKIVPKFYERWVDGQLNYAGSKRDTRKFIRTIIIISLVVAGVVSVFFRRYVLMVFPGTFFLVMGFFSVMLILSVDRRSRFVDEILPDALLLLSANIRAGYIPSRALILSARKEFGPLSEAIKRAGKEIMSGKSLEEGLRMIPSSIRSKDLKRTIDLIIQGIKGGGQLVALLEENANDIRRRQAITKEIKANTMMYAIFIAFAGCLGAPGLYALSNYLTNTMSDLGPDMSMSSGISSKVAFISLEGAKIDPNFLFNFSIGAILITTIFGGLILGLIGTGREKEGLKFAPILSIIALLVFLGATFIITTMFASMMPG